jgi:hypothetical protein
VLRVIATARDDGEIMAVEHREYPVVGVQFHPESVASEYGYAILHRFLRGDRAVLDDLPIRADGAHAAAEAPSRPAPWPSRDEEPDPFVPPPVERVR